MKIWIYLLIVSTALLKVCTGTTEDEEEQIFNHIDTCPNSTEHILNFACSSTGFCIRRHYVCDGVEICLNGLDEVKYDPVKHANSKQGIRCPVKSTGEDCFLPIRYVCDGLGHCRNNIDECGCKSTDFFICQEGECVHNSKICDGVKDCSNGADEAAVTSDMVFDDKGMATSPGHNGMKCATNQNTTCFLPSKYVDDGFIHCKGGVDECFNDTFFRCSNDQCVRAEEVCDGKIDCWNEIDERRSDVKLDNYEFMQDANSSDLLCKSKDGAYTCKLPVKLRCDGVGHCQGNVDECHNCSANITSEYHKCGETNQCIAHKNICNPKKTENCDQSLSNRVTPSNDMYTCAANKKLKCSIEHKRRCDGVAHCFYHEDECNCPNTTYRFNCGNGECLLMKDFCNSKPQCSNGRDDLAFSYHSPGFSCQKFRVSVAYIECDLPFEYVCDGTAECVDGLDETMCDDKIKLQGDNFKCLDGRKVIKTNQLCDGIVDCLDLSDECQLCGQPIDVCNNLCKPNDIGNSTCVPIDTICTGISNESYCQEKKDVNPYYELYGRDTDPDLLCCNDLLGCKDPQSVNDSYCASKFHACADSGRTKAHKYAIKGDCVITCDLSDDECANLTADSECYKKSSGTMQRMCDLAMDKVTLNDITINVPGNDICNGKFTGRLDEVLCANASWRFTCNNTDSDPINVHRSRVCDFVGDCADNTDEENCGNEKHFYCDPNRKGFVEFIDKSKVCDGREDCSNGLDECQSCTSSPFSDDNRLISSVFLRFIVWVSALVAIFGNIFALFETCHVLYKEHLKMETFTKASKMHLISLSTADLLVGIYLMSVAVADVSFEKYCTVDRWWRASTGCNAIGTIGLLGSQASVFTMLVLTITRYLAFRNPFHVHRLRFAFMRIILIWIPAIILATIPLMPGTMDYFVSRITYNDTRFWPNITRQENSVFVNKLALKVNTNLKRQLLHGTNATLDLTTEHSWSTLFSIMKTIQFSPRYEYGYYSAHGVCISNMYPDKNVDKAWGYTAFIMSLNFVIFVAIAAAYIQIYRFNAIRARRASDTVKTDNRIAKLQRRVTIIIIADFVCWMPICVTCFAKLGGAPVPDVMYAITAIVILPINSALNPIIYSSIPDKFMSLVYQPIREKFISTGSPSHSIGNSSITASQATAVTRATSRKSSAGSVKSKRKFSVKPIEKTGSSTKV